MLNKKMKVFLSVFTALTVMSTMCFATDVENSDLPKEENAVEITEVVENNTATEAAENIEITEENVEESSEASEENTEATNGGAAPVADQAAVETKNGDVYQTGDEIELKDSINGNVFIKANTLTVSGQIGGDLFVIANKVNLDGAQIYGNVFVIASEVTLNGLIYDMYGICQTLNVPYNGTVYRDLKVVCQDATINGVVGGSLNITSSGNLKLDSDCVIYKDLNYSHSGEIEIKDGMVQGKVNFSNISESVTTTKMDNFVSGVMSFVFTLVFTLVIWLLMTYTAPKFTEKVEIVGKNRPGMSILTGFLGLIIVPTVAILLLISIIGIPVSFALIALYCLVISITFTLTTVSLANILATKVPFLAKAKKILAVIIVALVLWLLTLIPFVKALALIVILLYGFGVFTLAILNKTEKKPKKEKVKKEKTEAVEKTSEESSKKSNEE